MDGTKTVSWQDPQPLVDTARDEGGLALWRKIASGEAPRPPIAELIGMGRIPLVEEGRIVFEITEPDGSLLNPLGTIHGGVLATLLDSAVGCAVHTTCPPGVGYTTLELKVNYVRAALPAAGALQAEGVIVHRGSRVATAEGRLTSVADGKLLAHATTTCLILG